MTTQSKSVKDQVKEIAIHLGIEDEVAEELATKCYDDVYWKPWGGATSFREVDEMEATRDFSYKVDMETSKLRGIISNITDTDDLNVDQKVSSIQSAAEDYRGRVTGLEISNDDKSLFSKIKEILIGKKEVDTTPTSISAGGFKVYVDKEGQHRWLSMSSNAFEDLEKELFTTKALEEAIEYADKSDERGPLLVYHIPSAEVGHCDFQAMAGRFLIESGTFDDTPLGNKALEYFTKSNEEHQVSIGYLYRDGDEQDGQYDWLRITERSICPFGAAANPWTSFKVIGESNMDSNHIAMLEKVFGSEMTKSVISEAETKTKELEQKVRFKEKTEPEVAGSLKNFKTIIDALPEDEDNKAVRDQLIKDYEILEKATAGKEYSEDDEDEDDEKKKEAKSESKEGNSVDNGSTETTPNESTQLREVATLITSLAESLDGVKETVTSLQADMKALKDEETEDATPSVASIHRPTENEGNVIGADAIKALVGAGLKEDASEDPAKKYVDDLFKTTGIAN